MGNAFNAAAHVHMCTGSLLVCLLSNQPAFEPICRRTAGASGRSCGSLPRWLRSA